MIDDQCGVDIMSNFLVLLFSNADAIVAFEISQIASSEIEEGQVYYFRNIKIWTIVPISNVSCDVADIYYLAFLFFKLYKGTSEIGHNNLGVLNEFFDSTMMSVHFLHVTLTPPHEQNGTQSGSYFTWRGAFVEECS